MTITQTLLAFFIEAEKLKTVMRHSYTSNIQRQESSAEHSWLMALMAMTLFTYMPTRVNQGKVLKLIIIHDLAEILVEDIPVFEISERKKHKHELEEKAIRTLVASLGKKTAKEFISLWHEYEKKETIEAKLVQSIDKMEVIIQHNISHITTWDQGDFDVHPFYRYEYSIFDPFLKKLREEVESMSFNKLVETSSLHRIKPKYRKKYKKIYST